MFLDQQAKLNNYTIGLNGVCDACKTLQAENEKLKEKSETYEKGYLKTLSEKNWNSSERLKYKNENEKLKEEIKELKTSLQTTTSYHTDRYELLEDEIQELKEKYEGELLTQEEFTKNSNR